MKFELLEPRHIPLLMPFFEAQKYQLSVFSLASVVSWRQEDGFSVHFAIEDETLFMCAKNPAREEENYLAIPLPSERYDPVELARFARELGCGHFNFVPEGYIAAHGAREVEKHFEVSEHIRYSDYVYHAKDLAELSGNRYAKKRNLIRQFERRYVRPGRASPQRITPELLPECRNFVRVWYEERRNGNLAGNPDDERAAFCAIEEFENLALTGIVIRIDDVIQGLGTCARLTNEMGVLNLQLAFPRFKGLYQYLDRECARLLFLNRFKYINKESAMGLDGLRQSKRSYHPTFRVRCYRLSLR